MRILGMRPEDLDATVEVWQAANVARGQPPGEARIARVRQKLTEPSAMLCVAVVDRVVGMVLAEPGRVDDGAGAPVPGLLHVSMVFVHPSTQRQGIGAALLRHLWSQAREAGVTSIGLWTNVANAAARRLYESVGMTPTRGRQVDPTRAWIRYEYEP